jgi:hypothetical protein
VDDRNRCNRILVQEEDWGIQIDRLVDTYLQYQQFDDGEMQSQPPLPNNPSGTMEVETIDVFCKSFANFKSNILTSIYRS